MNLLVFGIDGASLRGYDEIQLEMTFLQGSWQLQPPQPLRANDVYTNPGPGV